MEKKVKRKRLVPVPLNDGTNTPVPDKIPTEPASASEEALLRQANNPLGDPHKI
ncbi:MAG: hypothetical protein JWQ34_2666 [Mucilaginibacter sp.]|uniref:hypothetical protein n=1 Tax=Mucilaginibacter sp. TaxID=1882438 RepID=UPI002610CCFF|nr:hypothetical protein [Mucilaginibacter sp.]MDB5004441.1 hypothetical protein [Mucilaginibacter sp.]